jgi:hypothetical protein
MPSQQPESEITMKLNTLSHVAAATLLAFAGATSAMAQPTADSGYSAYRRVVLGDSTVAQTQAEQGPTRVVPGSYARHLIFLGVDQRDAIETARSVGEQPTIEAIAPSGQRLSAVQLYQTRFGIGTSVATLKTKAVLR